MIGLPDDDRGCHQKRRVVVEEAVIPCALVQSVCPGTNVVVVEEIGHGTKGLSVDYGVCRQLYRYQTL